MTTTNTAPNPQVPPVLNPAEGDYQNATKSPLNVLGSNPTLDEIIKSVRGEGFVPTEIPQEEEPKEVPTQEEQQEQAPEEAPPPDLAEMKTGDPLLDVAISTFINVTGASSEDIQRAVFKAIEHGDISLIDEEFIRERFGDKADHALQLSQAVVQHTVRRTQAVITDVYTVAGGKEQWEAAVGVFKQHASKGLTAAVVEMLNSGDSKAVKEAAELVLSYSKNSGVLPIVTPKVRGNAAPTQAQGLSAKEFQQAIHKLNPNSRTYTDDYNKLIQLRALGRSLNK